MNVSALDEGGAGMGPLAGAVTAPTGTVALLAAEEAFGEAGAERGTGVGTRPIVTGSEAVSAPAAPRSGFGASLISRPFDRKSTGSENDYVARSKPPWLNCTPSAARAPLEPFMVGGTAR